MAKAIQRFTWTGIKTDAAVNAFLKDASERHGGVWFARGVYGEVTIRQFANVSSIPDEFVGRTPRPELWKAGKLISFTPAQIRREANRGIFNDA